VIETRASRNPICRTSWDWLDGIVLPQPLDKVGIPAHRNGMQELAVEFPHVAMRSLTEANGVFKDRTEHRF
jgi:hypothetical protein